MVDPSGARDFVGYGRTPPHPQWPGNAKIAVQFVLNYEEGGENTVTNGDTQSETFLNETPNGVPRVGVRDISMETQFEYGSRCGVWRILNEFESRRLQLTCYAVGKALEYHPAVATALVQGGHEVASHSYRWIDYQHMAEQVEREHIRKSIAAITRTCGVPPTGWYTGRVSPRTRRLVVEEFEAAGIPLLYESDAYNDDLPYWVTVQGKPLLVVPYTLSENDMKFSVPPGFTSNSAFFEHLRDAFDVLYAEGQAGAPKMMTVGLHCRLVGRPARMAALIRFLDYIQAKPDVWIARRCDIAAHWRRVHPFNETKEDERAAELH